MRARIYRPAKTAMSSGAAKTRKWVMDFPNFEGREIDPLMGWTSSSNTQSQVRLTFDTKEAALEYAEEQGIEVTVTEPKGRTLLIRQGGYGDNFATGRRMAWTH